MPAIRRTMRRCSRSSTIRSASPTSRASPGKLEAEPKYVTRGAAGAGFAELAAHLLAHLRHALMEWWWAYLAIGVAVGFLAGLLGIGGGMVMVPMLVFVFTAKGFPAEHMMHLSLATSMATIVFTSLSSVRAHHRHGAVDWTVARAMAPGIVAGALAATLVAGFVPTRPLAIFFTGFMFYAATQMFFEVKPKPSRQLPGRAGPVRRRRGDRRLVQRARRGRRVPVDSVPRPVQRAAQARHRHRGGERFSDRGRRHGRLRAERPARRGPARRAASASSICRRSRSSSPPACRSRRSARASRTGCR